MGNISGDYERFKQIVKGHIKQKDNLKRYISRDEILGKKGNDIIRIPVPTINLPKFKHGRNMGGVGQGEGNIGDVIDPHSSHGSSSEGGNDPDSGDLMDVELSMNELEDMVFEELGLPYIEPKRSQTIHAQKPAYRSIAEQGVVRHLKRTYIEALKRMSASGLYQPGDAVVPIRRDFRYRAVSYKPDLQSNAVLFYLLDVSGSMGDNERRLCRSTNSWLQRIIGRYYKNIEERFIVHTTNAYEVEGPVFYGTKLAGGTQASSALQKTMEVIDENYPIDEWNTYCFYYSDGGNFKEDNNKALNILGNMLPSINLFCYGECSSKQELFMREIEKKFNLNSNKGSNIPRKKIRTSTLADDDSILETLRTFLAKDNVLFYQTKEN